MAYDAWLDHFRANPARHRALEATVEWTAQPTVTGHARAAFVRSFQRFELGESGDGERLLAAARRAGDPVYLAALTLLVEEEQKHSALFRRGLRHLGAPALSGHWSDRVFTALRRSLGLRTELALFLIAETVAMPYFAALAGGAPDPVLRAIGRRIATDERNHLRFQADRLRDGFATTPAPARALVGGLWGLVAAGAAAVLAVDHGPALRACGLRRSAYLRQASVEFRRAVSTVLGGSRAAGPLGPLGPLGLLGPAS